MRKAKPRRKVDRRVPKPGAPWRRFTVSPKAALKFKGTDDGRGKR